MKNKLQEKLQKLTGMEDASDFLIGSITDVSELSNIKAKDGSLIIERTNNTLYIFDEVSGWVAVSGTGGGGGGITSLLQDTTPQLGGNLDTNGNDITGTGDILVSGNITTLANLTGSEVTATGNLIAQLNLAVTGNSTVGGNHTVAGSIIGGAIVANSGLGVNGSITVTGNVDGRDVAADGTKLDTIENNATADQTGSEIVTAIDTELGGTGWQTGGSGTTDLSYTAATGVIASSSGADATLTLADGTNRGLMSNTDFTKLANIEALADVTDEANVISSLNGATLTAVTVAGTDKVIVQDASDSNNIKTVTAQSIADLGAAGSGIANVVEDTTPQLGGTLDLNGNLVGTASAADLTKLSQLTATSTELNYTDGVTSNIQTQLDTKTTASSGSGAPASTPSNVGDIYVDTTNDIIYIASGTASSADWEEQVVVDGTSLADGEILVWDATNSKFVRDPRVTGTAAVTAVDMNSMMGNFYSTTTASTTGTLTLNNAKAGGKSTIRIQNATAGGPTISGTGITVSKKGDWTTNYDTTNVNTIYIEMVTATLAWVWITAVD